MDIVNDIVAKSRIVKRRLVEIGVKMVDDTFFEATTRSGKPQGRRKGIARSRMRHTSGM